MITVAIGMITTIDDGATMRKGGVISVGIEVNGADTVFEIETTALAGESARVPIEKGIGDDGRIQSPSWCRRRRLRSRPRALGEA